jgi:hypothetical protein
MYRVLSKCVMLGFALAAPALMAQDVKAAPEPGRAIVSLYRIAPGEQLAFLKWMATRDAIDQQLNLPRANWYAHVDGDSWDYIAIGPQLTDAQQKQADDAARAKGLAVGPRASIEIRQFVASHTDTLSSGPMTASQLSTEMGNP